MSRDIGPAVRPILLRLPNRGGIELVGSSVLLRFGLHSFLATAGHVADHSERGELFVVGNDLSWPLPPIVATKAPLGRDKDQIDIAVCELPSSVVNEMEGVRYISSAEIDLDDVRANGPMYAVIGYPIGKERLIQGVSPGPIATVYSGLELSEQEYASLGYKRGSHIAVAFDEQSAVTTRGVTAIGHQNGISGGGIWRVDNLLDPRYEPRLVGITTWARRTGTKGVVGTRLPVIVEAIRGVFPSAGPDLPRSDTLKVAVDVPEELAPPFPA